MIDKKYSKDNDPEIPKDRIIDALRAGNKLSAAMATDIANMKIGSTNIKELCEIVINKLKM